VKEKMKKLCYHFFNKLLFLRYVVGKALRAIQMIKCSIDGSFSDLIVKKPCLIWVSWLLVFQQKSSNNSGSYFQKKLPKYLYLLVKKSAKPTQ